MSRGETAFGSAREEMVTAVRRALRVGLGVLLAIVSTSGPARAAEPPRGADNLVSAVKVLPDKAPDSFEFEGHRGDGDARLQMQ